MLVLALVLALALGAGCVLGAAQLETGVLAALYYPPPAGARPPTSSTMPPYARPARGKRSYFDREEGQSDETNDALLDRLRSNMTDPGWTPDVGPRSAPAH